VTDLSQEEEAIIMERRRPVAELPRNAFERHAQTALTSLVVLLLSGLIVFIFRISDKQTEMLIEQRTLQFQIQAIADAQKGGNGAMAREIERLDYAINGLWPRTRTHSENIEILKHHIEAKHPGLDIKLNDPEKF
jgi:hypothetical protein